MFTFLTDGNDKGGLFNPRSSEQPSGRKYNYIWKDLVTFCNYEDKDMVDLGHRFLGPIFLCIRNTKIIMEKRFIYLF